MKFTDPATDAFKVATGSSDQVKPSSRLGSDVGQKASSGDLGKDKRMNYKEKFRARVKTVLQNVRDLDIEEYDQQDRQSTIETCIATNQAGGHATLSNGLGVEDDPVDDANVVMFARKAFLILGLQLLVSAAWVSGVSQNKNLFNQIYPDSPVFKVLACLATMAIFSGVYFNKRVFGTYKTHVFISVALTASLSYLYGALAEYIRYTTMVYSFMLTLSFIAGVVTYCRIASEDSFSVKKSSLSGFVFMGIWAVGLYFCADIDGYTLFALWLISSLFGVALVLRTEMMSKHTEEKFLMKHYIFFSMVLYINFVKTAVCAAINTFERSSQAKVDSPQKPQENNQETTNNNLFTLTADIKQL